MVEIHPYREDVGSIHRPETKKLANGEVTIMDHSGYPDFCWLNPQSTTLCSHLYMYVYMYGKTYNMYIYVYIYI